MKKSRFTDSQIIAVLKQAQAGTPVPELCREHGISSATFYKWRSKFGGMEVSMVGRMKELEEENRRLKKMYADAQLSADLLKEALSKNGEAISAPGDGPNRGPRRTHQHPACLPDLRGQRDLLPLPSQGERGERPDRRLAGAADHDVSRLGVWPVLPVPPQRQGLGLEPQAGLPHLPGAGVEPADQAEEAPGAREARAAGGAGDDQPGLVDGLHARPAQRWPELPAVQRAGRLQPRGPGHRGRPVAAGGAGDPVAGANH